MRHSLPLLLILMLLVPFGVATADDEAGSSDAGSSDAGSEVAENAALKEALSQMAAERQRMVVALKDLSARVTLLTDELMATKARLRQVEQKLAGGAVAGPVEATVEPPASSSHPAALVGSYSLDRKHLREAMHALALQKVQAMIDQVPEESRAGVLEMLKTQIDIQVDKFQITLKLQPGGTFTAKGRTGTDALDASGTWSVQGKAFTLSTTVESGAALSEPDTQRGTIEGEVLMIVLEESLGLTVRMVRN